MRQELRQALRDHGVMEIPKEMKGEGYQVWAEGLVQGRAEERLKNIEGLLGAGVSWEIIESATGVDEAGFRKLRAR